MEEHGITHSIAIPDNVPNTGCADLRTLLGIIEGDRRFSAMGTMNLFGDLDRQISELDGLAARGRICAVKLYPGHDPIYPTDDVCHAVYELCIRCSMPVVVHTGINPGDADCAKYNDPKYLVNIAERWRELKIVIAHYFWPKMEYCYEITKDIPGIYYDTSAMADPEVVAATGGWNAVLAVLEKTVSKKPYSVVFGTDWPMCSIDNHLRLVRELKLDLATEEKVFYRNAVDLYRLAI